MNAFCPRVKVLMLSELLGQLKLDFLVPIDQGEADDCATVGELEHLVYTRVTQYRMDQSEVDELRSKQLERINRVAILDLSEPLTPADYDTDLALIANHRMTDRWEQTYLQIGLPINRHGIRIESPKWEPILTNSLGFIFLIAAVILWVVFGMLAGLLALVVSFIILSMISRIIPYRLVKDTTTLREAIDNYISEIEERIRDVSLWDVQIRVRSIIAELRGVTQDEVSASDRLDQILTQE